MICAIIISGLSRTVLDIYRHLYGNKVGYLNSILQQVLQCNCLLSLSAAVVQLTKRKTSKTEEVSSNLSSISFYFFPIICVLCFLFTLAWKKIIKTLSGAVKLNSYVRKQRAVYNAKS